MIKVKYYECFVTVLLCIWPLLIDCYELTVSSNGEVEINCDTNGNEESSINETLYPSVINFLRCPTSKKPYFETLKEFNINASRVSEIWFLEIVDIDQMHESLLQGMPLTKVVFKSTDAFYEVFINHTENIPLDLSKGVNYIIGCESNVDNLLNKQPLLPPRVLNVSHIGFFNCPSQNISYYNILQNLNLNPTSVKFLALEITAKSLPLVPGLFNGLSLHTLKVDNMNHKLDPKVFEEVAVDRLILRQVEIKAPPKWRIKRASLAYGKFNSEWGDCTMLTELELIRFSVPEISGGWLCNCSKLTELTLRELQKKDVHRSLVGARALETLIIEDSNTGRLRTPWAVDAVNLRSLKISDKTLTYISVDAFSAFKKLEELVLDGTDLIGADILQALTPLKNLRDLKIVNNPVELFCDDMRAHRYELDEPSKLARSVVRGLNRLYLRYSPLSSICFQDWYNLTHLDLSYNKITKLQIEGLPVPRDRPLTVNLKHNPLTILPSTVDIEEFKDSQNLTILLNLTVDCDCEHSPLVKALHELPQLSLRTVMCTSGVRFVDFNGDRFNCYKYPCGNCTCRTSLDDGATIADCDARRLHAFPKLWSSLQRSSEISNEVFVRNISAPNNLIEKLPDFEYPERLIEIDLRNNKITRISGSALDALFSDGNRRVLLSGNPFVCECEAQDMIDTLSRNQNQVADQKNCQAEGRQPCIFVKSTSRSIDLHQFILPCDEIPDYNLLTCSNRESSLRELQNRSLCTARALLAIGIVTSSLLALAAIAAFIFVRYKLTIKAFLYARGLCLSCVREEELDAGREYDAFVSFAHPDDEFVADVLLSGLENDYNLCVHTRNWMPGEMIHTQIMESVQKSRRTIIVLSKSFVESMWGMTEFRTAYSNSLREGRVRVICVVVDDVINDVNLDSELKSYLKSNTYLKFNDPWFWQKLRYAMPHPSVTGDRNEYEEECRREEVELASR